MTLPPGKFRVGEFEVEPRTLEVRCGSDSIKLEPKVMGVLVDLASAAGETRTKEEIMASVWPDVTVGEAVLSRSISILRSILHDDPKNPSYIETIPRIGYRFVADVVALQNGAGPAAGTSDPAPRPPVTSARRRRLLLSVIGLALVAVVTWVALRPAVDESQQTPQPTPQLPTLLTSAPGAETSPSVSRDGRLVVYSGSNGAEAMSVYLLRRGSGEAERISGESAAEMWPVFSPTADRVAWIRHWGDRCEIVILDLASRTESVLAECGVASLVGGLDWSPDGAFLAVADGPGVANLRIVFVSAADGTVTPRTDPPAGISDVHPEFSPDGGLLAYIRDNAIRVHDLATGDDREVASPGRVHGPLAWTEDSAEIMFARGAGEDTDLWSVGLDGQMRLISGGRGGRWPSSYPGGLVFGVVSADANLSEVDLNTRSRRIVHPSTRIEAFPTVSPYGAVTFVSGRSGSAEVWSDRAGQLAQLTHLEADDIYRPRWSPDGERLVFAAEKDGRTRLYWLRVATGTVTEILSDSETTWSGAWSTDGQSIYYTSDQGGSWQLYRHDLNGGRSVPLGVDGAAVCDVGPDGRVYFVRDDTDGIHVWNPNRPADAPRLLLADFNRLFDFWNWSVQGDTLWVIQRDDSFAPVLARFPIDGGDGTRLGIVHGITWSSGLTVTEDQQLLTARIVRRESDLYHMALDSADGSS